MSTLPATLVAAIPSPGSNRIGPLHAYGLMIALGVASAAVMVLCTPQLVSAGVSGAMLVFVGFVATLLRTRHSRTRTTVLIAMVSGVTGIAVAAVSAAQTHPDWRPALALGLAGAAAVVVEQILRRQTLPRHQPYSGDQTEHAQVGGGTG